MTIMLIGLLCVIGSASWRARGESAVALPNTKACCAAAGVNSYCTANLCDINQPPGYTEVFNAASRCARSLNTVARCMADGRNHAPCCAGASRTKLSCLHLCDGSPVKLNVSNWNDGSNSRFREGTDYSEYVSCLSFNVKAIYQCIRAGYATHPGPPTRVSVGSVDQTSALVSWHASDKLADKVKEYVVSYQKSVDVEKRALTVSTSSTGFKITGLSPDTKYEVYVVAKAQTDAAVSLHSDSVTFVTHGVPPKASAYAETVMVAKDSIITLVCSVEVFGSQHISDVSLKWFKFSDGSYKTIDYNQKIDGYAKYKTYSYPRQINFDGRNVFMMTLKLRDFEEGDVGSYKCVSRNSFGQDSAIVSVREAPVPTIPREPRNITSCCIAETKNSCPEACRDDSEKGVQSAKVPNLKCVFAEITKVLKCSNKGLDYKSCCVREGVQDRCLPFCDGRMDFSRSVPVFDCIQHSRSIVDCHLEAMKGFPSPPDGVSLKAATPDSLQLAWREVGNADRYVVYYREVGSTAAWQYATTVSNALKLNRLKRGAKYNVLVLAGNRAGLSDNSKPVYIDLAKNRAFYSA